MSRQLRNRRYMPLPVSSCLLEIRLVSTVQAICTSDNGNITSWLDPDSPERCLTNSFGHLEAGDKRVFGTGFLDDDGYSSDLPRHIHLHGLLRRQRH
jgi:hypothetical protein